MKTEKYPSINLEYRGSEVSPSEFLTEQKEKRVGFSVTHNFEGQDGVNYSLKEWADKNTDTPSDFETNYSKYAPAKKGDNCKVYIKEFVQKGRSFAGRFVSLELI